jgi:hypothetical protein
VGLPQNGSPTTRLTTTAAQYTIATSAPATRPLDCSGPLKRTHAELRAAPILTGDKRMIKPNFRRRNYRMLPILRRVLAGISEKCAAGGESCDNTRCESQLMPP